MKATVIIGTFEYTLSSMKDARELAKVDAQMLRTEAYIIKGNDKYAYEYYDMNGKAHKSEVPL